MSSIVSIRNKSSILRRTTAVATLCIASIFTASDARAETVTATLSFLDGDGHPAPIANARVEIWLLRGICCWHVARNATTDAQGRLREELPFAGAGATYALRVFATNPAVQVFTPDLFTIPFWREPGRPGPEIQRRVSSPSDVLDFSWQFSDDWARNPFNVADAIRRGRAYADARRDPRETDVIPRLDVLLTSSNTFYDPVSHLMRLNTGHALDDLTVLHEYAHFLQEAISSFLGIAAFHDGCTASIFQEPGYAWMEGFASYFAQAVALEFGADVDGPGRGTLPLARMESPSCPGSTLPLLSLELFVAGALWDLIDSTNEPGDRLCRTGTGIDTIVFQIFDRELDTGWRNPNLQEFADAWAARGLDLPPLLAAVGTSGLQLRSPAPLVHYDRNPAVNAAVWRPGARAFWHISHSAGSGLVEWGTSGDRPVPADYDGDGLTDIAVWRPSDGRWHVVKSASGRSEAVAWGISGDVPLPGDYDGDGETDYAVYRPSDGHVYIFNDSCGLPWRILVGARLVPIVGDFDGDGTDEPGRYDPATGWFWIARGGGLSYRVGTGGGTPVVADYDGDGRSDAAVFRPDTGYWDIRRSSTGAVTSTWWGDTGDIAVPADYDLDGRADLVTWTPASGAWWVLTASGRRWRYDWGTRGDVPVPAP